MKIEVGILLAGSVGFLAVLGLISFKKLMQKKNKDNNSEKYSEYHPYHGLKKNDDDSHGIELYALQ